MGRSYLILITKPSAVATICSSPDFQRETEVTCPLGSRLWTGSSTSHYATMSPPPSLPRPSSQTNWNRLKSRQKIMLILTDQYMVTLLAQDTQHQTSNGSDINMVRERKLRVHHPTRTFIQTHTLPISTVCNYAREIESAKRMEKLSPSSPRSGRSDTYTFAALRHQLTQCAISIGL